MIEARAINAPKRAPSVIQIGRRLAIFIGLTLLLAVAAWLWLSWQYVRDEQLARMTTTVRLVAAHADHYLASLGNKMEVLARDLAPLDPLARPQEALALLKAFKDAQPDVIGAGIIRADGQVLAATLPSPRGRLPNMLSNPEMRADFESALRADGLSLGRPQPGAIVGSWVIYMRHTVRDRRGQARYLIQAGIPLEKQQALWHSLGLSPDAVLGLLRDDGYLISRIPGPPSANLYNRPTVGGALYEATRAQPDSGHYEGRVVDGSYRIGAYQRLARQPMYAFHSHRLTAFAAIWWEQVRLPLALALFFLLASVIGYWRVASRYRGRLRAVEASLNESGTGVTVALPSSGLREIDTLVAALADTQAQLRSAALNREKLLLTAADAGTYVVRERDGVVLAADAAFLLMLGRHESEVVGHAWQALLSEPVAAIAEPSDAAAALARRILCVVVPAGDKPRWISVAEYRDTMAGGESVRYGLAIDVSDRERLLSQVNVQSQRLQALWQLATTRDKSDAEKMQLMLRLALDTLHMDTVLVSELCGDKLVVRNISDDLHLFHAGQQFLLNDTLCRYVIEGKRAINIPDLRADPDLYRHPLSVDMGLRVFASAPIWAGHVLYGTMVFLRRAPLDESFSADDCAFMELLAAWFGQILIERQQHEELENMAMTDALTRLINRRAAEARFIEEFARARRTDDGFSIAVCDLDRFKLVNDHYGHDTGDLVLRHVAGILKAELREGDWVARWGGEEFIIFLHQSDATEAHAAMERLRLAIKDNPVSTEHGPLDITTSIGIGTFRGDGDLASVLSEADGCLFEAKHAGRDRVVMSASSRRGTLWKAGMLQHALLENRLVPAYQVMVDLRTNEVVADEALARLIEPDGRILPAGEFIEAAEGINLIHVVDEVIARQSIQRCALHLCNSKDKPGFAHFINLSPQFLARRELVQAMLQQTAQYCVQAGMADMPVKPMVLEITERQMIGNFEDLRKDLQPLLDFGFRLALDDFGSGYSSFLYLASLPVSFLKIEGWMVQNMRTNPRVLGMVKSIIALARDQGLTTIAECVEDAATADLLRELGADWGQGWYFGRPECEIDPAQVIQIAHTGTR
jgi:diguanylate cyclase